MSMHEERDRYLAEQTLKFGEPILTLALGRVLEGPSLGSEIVFLLVSASSLHFAPTVRDATVFGLLLSKKAPKEPEATSLPRERVTNYGALAPRSWWTKLTGPQDVVKIEAETDRGPAVWKIQLVGDFDAFLAEWTRAWAVEA